MATEIERIDKLEGDMVDVRVRLGVAESDIKSVKETLKKIDHNISKVLWGVIGTFGTVLLGIITLVINHLWK